MPAAPPIEDDRLIKMSRLYYDSDVDASYVGQPSLSGRWRAAPTASLMRDDAQHAASHARSLMLVCCAERLRFIFIPMPR